MPEPDFDPLAQPGRETPPRWRLLAAGLLAAAWILLALVIAAAWVAWKGTS